MKSRTLLALAAAGLAGCAARQPVHVSVGGPGDKSGRVVDDSLVAYIKASQKIKATDDVLLHATDKNKHELDYWVVFGPMPNSSKPAVGGLHNSLTTFWLQEGFALLWGTWPTGTDGIVDIGADGTTLVMQSDGQFLHRFFLLKNPTRRPTHVQFTGDPDTKRVYWSDEGTYIQVMYDDTGKASFSKPTSYAGNTELQKFIDAVIQRAKAAGIDPSNL